MRIDFHKTRGLLKKAFKGDKEAEAEYDRLSSENREKIALMFRLLTEEKIDLFIQADGINKTGRGLIRTWTRSEKSDKAVRATTWMAYGNEQAVEALSDSHSKDVEELLWHQDEPDTDLYVLGRRLDNGSHFDEERYFENVIVRNEKGFRI